MAKYLGKRLGMGLVTLLALMTITFFMMHLIPGSPFAGEMSKLPASVKETLIRKYMLDRPIGEQYLVYLRNVLHGDLGISLNRKGQSVVSIIARGLPYTAKLGFVAFCVAMVGGILLGTAAAFTKRAWMRTIISFVATIGVSVPGFLFALFFMYVFGVWLGVLPLIGLAGPANYVMPALSLAIGPVAMISRLVKTSLTEELRQDYMVLARAKGTSRIRVIFRHALKNALLPVITYAGPLLATLLTGSFVVETMFSIPGIGAEFVGSVSSRDYTMIMALTILYGGMIIVVNMLTDILTALIDPRVRLS